MKYLKTILPIVCIAFVAFFFAGCSLNVPEVTANGYNISWNKIANATVYEVEVDGEKFKTTETNANLIAYLQDGRADSIKVRAMTTNFFYSSSSYSKEISIVCTGEPLSTPTNFALDEDQIAEKNVYIFSWDAVANASSYCLKFENENGTAQYAYTNTTSYNATNFINGAGAYTAKIFAYNEDITAYSPSAYSDAVEFVFSTRLDSPSNRSLSYNSGKLNYSWNSVAGASGYNVSVLNGKTYSTTETSISIPMIINSGDAVFVTVQAVSDNKLYNLDSAYSDMNAYYSNASKTSYTGKTYSFNGREFDLVADDYDELETIIHFGLYYRLDKINFFANYTAQYGKFTSGVPNDTNCDVDKALASYVEIKYISYGKGSESAMTNSYSMFSIPVSYLHTNYPTKTASGNNNCEQVAGATPSSYTTTPRASTFDNFKIESRTNSMMVYNTDQLYYAIQYGYKPTFPTGDSPAKQAYETAKSILREIIDDDMTEYEKTLAIFDWLCYNVAYDHNLLDLTERESTKELYNYRGFYIEGVLFDGGQAVCDGIGKTFVLLCGIEDIECYKVTGTSNGDGHAWNKVKLDLNNDGVKEWYAVDATWSDLVDSTTNDETLSHMYFLKTDAYMTQQAHTETHPLTDVAETEFNYYAYETYDGTNNLLIESTAEMETLVQYIRDNSPQCIEILIKPNSLGDYVNMNYYKPTLINLGYSIQKSGSTLLYVIYKE